MQSLFCHSWQINSDRSVSAMILIIALIALVVWAVIATVIELRRDGHRRIPTDWTRVAERDALNRAEAGHVFR